MRPFRPKFIDLMQQQEWWWSQLSPEARLVWLAMVGFACSGTGGNYSGDGVFQVGPAGLAASAGLGPDHEIGERAIDELLAAGAIENVNVPSQRWVYRLTRFQAIADALDTRGAALRAAYQRRKAEAGA